MSVLKHLEDAKSAADAEWEAEQDAAGDFVRSILKTFPAEPQSTGKVSAMYPLRDVGDGRDAPKDLYEALEYTVASRTWSTKIVFSFGGNEKQTWAVPVLLSFVITKNSADVTVANVPVGIVTCTNEAQIRSKVSTLIAQLAENALGDRVRGGRED